jgi:hypothetical protein
VDSRFCEVRGRGGAAHHRPGKPGSHDVAQSDARAVSGGGGHRRGVVEVQKSCASMAAVAFDSTGESYAHISGDSRVKIWDVASGACSHE